MTRSVMMSPLLGMEMSYPGIAHQCFDLLLDRSPLPIPIGRLRFVFWNQDDSLLSVPNVYAKNDRAIDLQDAQGDLIAEFHGLIVDRRRRGCRSLLPSIISMNSLRALARSFRCRSSS